MEGSSTAALSPHGKQRLSRQITQPIRWFVLRSFLNTQKMGMLTYWCLHAFCIIFVPQGGRRFLSSPQWSRPMRVSIDECKGAYNRAASCCVSMSKVRMRGLRTLTRLQR
jgi:hypothetical protein